MNFLTVGTVVEEIFGTIGEGVTSFITVIKSAITSIVQVFWDGTTGFTFLGTLAIIAVCAGLVWAIVRLIRGSMRIGGRV